MRRSSLALCFVSLLASRARAQPGGDIDLQAFRPAIDSRGLLSVNRSQVLGAGEPSFGLVTTWGKSLLRFSDGDHRYEVQHVVTPTLVAALGLRPLGLQLELGASLPFPVVSGDRAPDSDAGTPGDPNDDQSHGFDGQGMGDAALHLKWRLPAPRSAGVGVALIGSLSLPTASDAGRWLGDRALVPQLSAVVDVERGPFAVAGNVGLRWRGGDTTRFVDDQQMPGAPELPLTHERIEVGSSVPFGLGAAYAVAPERFDLIAELYGAVPLAGENYFPLEALAGAKLYLAQSSHLSFGAGTGLLREQGGNPELRAFLGIVFEPRPSDRDGDGIRDRDDLCPTDPEDRDGFEDRDGCPERDDDRDRIADGDDACPHAAEDVDGFEDEDGCPDPDNDGDLIRDDDDACPRRDGEATWQTAEVYNLVADEDGCPDEGGRVIQTETAIEILDAIHFEFDSAVIQSKSHPILRAVARTILTSPALRLIEVQGHTDERGADAYNLDLSQRRAEAVVAFLVAEGVAAERLRARGYGERRPVEQGSGERAWAANRRVEFVIVSADP